MKKFLSLILALAMVACMSVTAFAADPTTTLTVEVPDNTPSYTFHCPASVTLEYGNTDKQEVGDVYVTDVKNCNRVDVKFPYTDLVNINDSSDKIPLALFCIGSGRYDEDTNNQKLEKNGCWYHESGSGNFHSWPFIYVAELAGREDLGVDSEGYKTQTLKAQVSDWSGATPGATYQATITYVVIAK